MLETVVTKMLEYAPAVAILLYIDWRQSLRLDRILDWCLEDKADDRSRDDNTE